MSRDAALLAVLFLALLAGCGRAEVARAADKPKPAAAPPPLPPGEIQLTPEQEKALDVKTAVASSRRGELGGADEAPPLPLAPPPEGGPRPKARGRRAIQAQPPHPSAPAGRRAPPRAPGELRTRRVHRALTPTEDSRRRARYTIRAP